MDDCETVIIKITKGKKCKLGSFSHAAKHTSGPTESQQKNDTESVKEISNSVFKKEPAIEDRKKLPDDIVGAANPLLEQTLKIPLQRAPASIGKGLFVSPSSPVFESKGDKIFRQV